MCSYSARPERVQASKFRVLGFGLRVFGFWVPGSGFQVSDCEVLHFGFRFSGFEMLSFGVGRPARTSQSAPRAYSHFALLPSTGNPTLKKAEASSGAFQSRGKPHGGFLGTFNAPGGPIGGHWKPDPARRRERIRFRVSGIGADMVTGNPTL